MNLLNLCLDYTIPSFKLEMQAPDTYNAGIMQYTIRQVPKQVDKALRARAKAQKKSLNQIALEALAQIAGVSDDPAKPKRDLSFMGKMDDETYKAIQEVRAMSERIWPEDWK